MLFLRDSKLLTLNRVKQDNLILSTLMSFLTEGMLAQVVNYTTSHAVWHALDETFSSKSCEYIVQIRTQLATATKGSKSATEYFHFIKRLADELAIARQPMTRDYTITYILAGLGHEYDSFVASIFARTDSQPSLTLLNANHNHLYGMAVVALEEDGEAIVDAPKETPKQAMVAMTNGNPTNWETEWHADTGATHHLTNTASNMNQQNNEYNGLDTVQVGNGQGLLTGRSFIKDISVMASTRSPPKQAYLKHTLVFEFHFIIGIVDLVMPLAPSSTKFFPLSTFQ
ncbi:hypothetical protein Patl1_37257 [Pistacia atlantica]|nr:hypothetical protein Patl1_37257 [Pistacia atlantica]